MNIEELIHDLRARINPQYYDQPGTESYERNQCVMALEYLRQENERLRKGAGRIEWQPIETAPIPIMFVRAFGSCVVLIAVVADVKPKNARWFAVADTIPNRQRWKNPPSPAASPLHTRKNAERNSAAEFAVAAETVLNRLVCVRRFVEASVGCETVPTAVSAGPPNTCGVVPVPGM